MVDLSSIVKAYDIRGTVPDQLNEQTARAFGTAFVQLLRGEGELPRIVVAHDMREAGPGLVDAFAAGATELGVDVVHVGLGSTDLLYYASGIMDVPGAMFTASHNPAEYNGIKLCRSGARPIGQESGLADIRATAERLLSAASPQAEPGSVAEPGTAGEPGSVERRDMLADYAAHLRNLVDLAGNRELTVVVDAGNGMGGYTVPAVLGDGVLDALPLRIVPLYFELDGTFPNHEANPIDPKNLVDLQAAVREHNADIGLAFDGDADRCFVVDERGEAISPSAITALVAARELAKHPGATVIHNIITSRAVPEIVAENGGTAVRTRVGHSFIKAEMARTEAVFGGEHSAHYYFKDFWYADTGMLAAMHVLAALGEQAGTLSELAAAYHRYPASGEINTRVADQQAKLIEVKQAFQDRASIDELDGLTVDFADGSWFNLRPSNTEPLVRLNVEARDAERMAELRDEVLALVNS
ncbi:MAG: phosphomannomutase/phosphoglucomutase [Micromonosporaceae bacterium]